MRMERVRWREVTCALQTSSAMRVRDVCTPRKENVSEKCAFDTECVHKHSGDMESQGNVHAKNFEKYTN